jgi:hypothetical protein
MNDANLEDPNAKNIKEEVQLPVNTYKIIEPPSESLEDRFTAKSLYVDSVVNEEAKVQPPASEPPAPQPPSREVWIERLRRFAENPTRVYAAIGVGLGVLLGVIFAAVSLLTGNPEGRYDLGPVTSSATGLKGHLYIKWEKTLQYRLTFEPSAPERQAGFARAVVTPPHPLSIEIQLQDAQGSILCSKDILLRYDARSAAIATASTANLPARKTDAANLPSGPPAANDFAQLEAQERKREQGKDIFQNQIAPDGQVAAINAQGEIPCSAKAYENTTQWSFTTNFPSLDEQDEELTRQQKMRTSAAQKSAVHKKATAKPAAKLLPFSIEGDDAIIEFDVNRGVIETIGRKTFFLDKSSTQSAGPVWQDYPVSIHFRCNWSSDCTLMHAGAGALRVKLRR